MKITQDFSYKCGQRVGLNTIAKDMGYDLPECVLLGWIRMVAKNRLDMYSVYQEIKSEIESWPRIESQVGLVAPI